MPFSILAMPARSPTESSSESVVTEVGRGVGEVVELLRAAEDPDAVDLVDQRLDERLLELDAAQVAAVADAVPGADQTERLLAAERVRAGREIEVAVAVL